MKQCLEKIDDFISKNVVRHKGDWFNIDRERFVEDNLSNASIIGVRETGSDLVFLNIDDKEIENDTNRVFGQLGNKKFLLITPFYVDGDIVEEADFEKAFKMFCAFIPQEWAIRYNCGWEIVKNKKI